MAVEALGMIGAAAAPDLVVVGESAPAEAVRDGAGAELMRIGPAAVDSLIGTMTADNAEAHFRWLEDLDPNWKLRNTTNPVARACQQLPEVSRRLEGVGDPTETVANLNALKPCGSAARVAMPGLLARLADKDTTVQAGAVEVLIGIGPVVTPELLAKLPTAAPTSQFRQGLLHVLAADKMWDAAALKHPTALPALLSLIRQNDSMGQQIAVRHLGNYGPAASDAVPYLVPHVAAPDEATRAAVRRSLGQIDPDWKRHPGLTANLPNLVYPLAALPAAESDDLYAAVGELPADGVERVLRQVNERLSELRKQYGRTNWDKPTLDRYAKDLDPIFGPIERLGPKMKPMVGVLTKMMGANYHELNDPKAPVLAARLMKTLDIIAEGSPERIRPTIWALGYGKTGLAFLKSQGKAAIPYIGELIDSPQTDQRYLGLQAATALGPDAAELAPKVIAAIPQSHGKGRIADSSEDIWMLDPVINTLNTIDPDWWGRPEAAKALVPFLKVNEIPNKEWTERRAKMLGLIEASAKRARPVAGPLAAEFLLEGGGGIDAPLRALLDTLDPKWREAPAIKKLVPVMVKRMAGPMDFRNERTLVSLGAGAAPALAEGLEWAATLEMQKGPAVRTRMLAVLRQIGPDAKAAVPAILKLVAEPELSVELFKDALNTLAEIDPEWATDPERKDTVAQILTAILKRAETSPEFYALCGRIGAPAVPELVKRLGGPKPAAQVPILAALGELGPVAVEASPTVERMIRDKDVGVRRAAVAAVGKINPGKVTLVPTLLPGLLDAEPGMQQVTGTALDRVDPDWRTRPRTKETTTQAIKLLSHKDPPMRWAGLGALEVIGPADGVVAAVEKMIADEKDAKTKDRAEMVLKKLKEK